jgi:hypothetical protein
MLNQVLRIVTAVLIGYASEHVTDRQTDSHGATVMFHSRKDQLIICKYYEGSLDNKLQSHYPFQAC